MHRRKFLALAAASAAGPAFGLGGSTGALRATAMATGLSAPWGFGFLPGGDVVITERGGWLRLLRADGRISKVAGVGKVAPIGQGGLLDVMVPRDFARSRMLFFTYAKRQGGGNRAGTAVASARLSSDGARLENWRDLFEMTRGSRGGRHFGSRIVEGRDGMLYVTVGERGDRPSAQDLTRENGSVIRITRGGAIPQDNPFVNTPGARPEIWSYGHRNPQGAALDASGRLWLSEHGAKGGDEVNQVRRGHNYGWPVISYGRHYSGGKIGEGSAKPGMEQPAFYWDPSIAPSGLMIYGGKMFPEWRGHFFVGSLKFSHIARLSGSPLKLRERIKGPETGRVRDIREAPDGAIWFLSEINGALYRISR